MKITSPMKSDRLFLKEIKTFSVHVLSDLKIIGFACESDLSELENGLDQRTRKKGIVSALAGYGMSVSYDRVQHIELSVTKQLCKVFQEKGVVCPPTLKNCIFTTAARDNIDHNPSSATEAFHDTSISIFQHPEEEHPELGLLFDEGIEKINVPIEFPESYTTIFPAKTLPSQYPLQQVCAQDVTSNDQSKLFTADEWLGNISSFNNARGMETPDVNERICWSAFHARLEQPSAVQQKSTSTPLPLLRVSVASPAVVRHTMNIVNLVLQDVNPGQVYICFIWGSASLCDWQTGAVVASRPVR